MILLLILALFIFPLALAWMMFTGSIPLKSENTRNLGRLVIPTVPLDWSGVITVAGDSVSHSFDGFWVILYTLPLSCTKNCLNLAAGLRQVHLASGQNYDHIKVALLLEPKSSEFLSDELLSIYQGFNLISSPSQDFSGALRQAGGQDSDNDVNPAVYLVDPHGNIMMTYNSAGSPNKLNKDLTRLLTWSKLDKRL